MDKRKQENAKKVAKVHTSTPRSLELAINGINTSTDFARVMSTVMSDLIEGTIQPQIANAVCNAGGKLLKVVELQHKYGKAVDGKSPVLQLTQ